LPTGTVLGQPFTPVDGSALVLGEKTCTVAGFQASTTGVLLGFGSFQGLCSFVTSTQFCGVKANSTFVTALVARANVLGRTAPAVVPGTYSVAATIPSPDAQGDVSVVSAVIARTGTAPVCEETLGAPEATSGTVRIDSISDSRITGTVDLTFEGGSRVQGAFDVVRCGFQTDVCAVLAAGEGECSGGTDPVCVP
jgi:hypothetical protein